MNESLPVQSLIANSQTADAPVPAEQDVRAKRDGAFADAGTAFDALARARSIDDLERIRRAVEAVGETAYHWSIETDRLLWSDGAGEVLGGPEPSAISSGKAFANLLDPDNFTSRYESVMRATAKDSGAGVPFAIEYLLRPLGRNDTQTVWLEDSGRWYAGADGRPREVYGIVRRIDDRHERDQHLRFLGNCDPLTGMMNRGRLAEALGEVMASCDGEGQSCGFLVAAIGNLAVVNDAYGFDIADEVIVSIGRRMRQVVRTGDLIGRYSGSKFGVILRECTPVDLENAAERFLAVARDSVIETERGPVWAMLSIGGLVLPNHAKTSNTAMARAEEALTEAKRQPTDGFVAFKPSPETVSVRGLNARCAGEIVSSLRDERFALAYQPIVSASTGDVVMHEALLRMRCEDGEMIAAAHLIPIAEKLGLVRLIDRTVMRIALDLLQAHSDARLALNVSGITATDPRWFGQLTAMLSEAPGLTERVTIEITETVALNDLDATIRFINSLRDLGCKVAIDDFGAGYTSFRNLKVLNVDMVKIDGSFCERLSENRDDQYFVRSLIDLAQKFNLETVAEWVQHESDAELLRAWGVDYLQGSLFGNASVDLPWVGNANQGTDKDLPASLVFDTSRAIVPSDGTAAADGDDVPFKPRIEPGDASEAAVGDQVSSAASDRDDHARECGDFPFVPREAGRHDGKPNSKPAVADVRSRPEPDDDPAQGPVGADDELAVGPAPDLSRLKQAREHLDTSKAVAPVKRSADAANGPQPDQTPIDLAGAIAASLGNGTIGVSSS